MIAPAVGAPEQWGLENRTCAIRAIRGGEKGTRYEYRQTAADINPYVAIATCLAAAVSTLVMGLYANYPIALAPGMGLNAFFAFTVVLGYKYTWQQALAAVFCSGVIFFALVNLIKVPPYLALGQFTRANLMTSAVLFPLAIVSTWAGVASVLLAAAVNRAGSGIELHRKYDRRLATW